MKTKDAGLHKTAGKRSSTFSKYTFGGAIRRRQGARTFWYGALEEEVIRIAKRICESDRTVIKICGTKR